MNGIRRNVLFRRLTAVGVIVIMPFVPLAAFAWEILVGNGDTLMGIAKQTREADSTTIEQQAVAIFERNQGAFLNDNMNGLERGSTLRIPGADVAEALSPDEAKAKVRQHHVDWYQGVVVKRGETLMKIASETRKSESTTVDQQALALFELNPTAFSKGNINGLRWGTKLRLPSSDTAEAIDPEQALKVINQQNRDWHRGAKPSTAANSANSSKVPVAEPSRPRARQLDQPQPVTIIRGSNVEVTTLKH